MAKSVHQRHRLVVDLLLAVGAPLRAFEAFLREGGRR